jgi:hypothetical protein
MLQRYGPAGFISAPVHGCQPLTRHLTRKEDEMGIGTILLIVLVLILLGVIPTWPHSRQWGYAPSGIVSIILIVLLVMLLTGRL